MNAKTFEDLEVWQVSRGLVKEVYEVTGRGAFRQDFALRDQVRRAIISVNSNIAEGFDRSSNKEFAHFLSMAKASASEVRSQLYLAADLTYLDASVSNQLNHKLLRLSRQLSALITYLKQHPRTQR